VPEPKECFQQLPTSVHMVTETGSRGGLWQLSLFLPRTALSCVTLSLSNPGSHRNKPQSQGPSNRVDAEADMVTDML
jgi:hypothetical protein